MIQVFHFHNGTGGGVLSVIRNLLLYTQNNEIENHVIYTINQEEFESFDIPRLTGAISENIFYYSPKWNFYYTCTQLSKYLSNEKAIIVAHDWLELGMISNLGLQNPVVQYVHGAYDYYYDLAVKHSPWVDGYIVVAKHIEDELIKRMPERKNDIYYLRFPVPDIKCEPLVKYPGLNIVFTGRCVEEKGYPMLPKVEKELHRRGVKVKWHIVGEYSSNLEKQQLWSKESDVKFYGLLPQSDVFKILCKSHLFILPSKAEGMPVSVIEAMKAGVIPIVSDLKSGVTELVLNEVTGYVVSNNNYFEYANVIEKINTSENLSKQLSIDAKDHITNLFEPINNAKLIEDFIFKLKLTQSKLRKKKYGSTLDQKLLPNFVTLRLRKLLHFLRVIFS